MATTSTAPAAITALVALWKARPGLSGVDVHDGQPMSQSSADYICVGHDPADPLTAVEGGQVPASLGNRARTETYDVLCSLASTSGATDMAERRARAMALFAEVEAAVRADVTLSGAVMTAQVGTYSLIQEQTNQGSAAGLRFRITCTARLTT